MPSPFPGMDPYLEAQGLWEGFHAAMIACCTELLNQNLPDDYVAQIETRITLVTQEFPDKRRIPDLLIGREPDAPVSSLSASTGELGVATIEPITLPLAMGEVETRERWIEISSIPEMDLVTVIEILSPTNKAGSGRTEYLEKRAAIFEQPVNFVEIDLLLGGRRTPMARKLPAGDFYAVVARTADRPNAQVYAWTIRHPLPPVPIPLREPDRDVMLALGEAFELTYNRGRYSRLLRHGGALAENLALGSADRDWAESVGK
jgi:Protein of unknown function (DUF4058)